MSFFQQDLGPGEDPTDQLSFSQLANRLLQPVQPDDQQHESQWDDEDAAVRELREIQREVNNEQPYEHSDDDDLGWRDRGQSSSCGPTRSSLTRLQASLMLGSG